VIVRSAKQPLLVQVFALNLKQWCVTRDVNTQFDQH